MSGVNSQGTTLKIKVGSSYVNVAGFKNFSGIGGGNASIIDASDLSSVAKEKLVGLPDEGSAKITLNYVPADPGQVAMEAARTALALTAFQITLVNNTVFSFNGFVQSFEKSAGVDALVAATASIEISGAVTKTLPSS